METCALGLPKGPRATETFRGKADSPAAEGAPIRLRAFRVALRTRQHGHTSSSRYLEESY